jgi:ATP-dependent DNA helicase RecG
MEVNKRIGVEISAKTVKRALDGLIEEAAVTFAGERRWRRYRLADKGH